MFVPYKYTKKGYALAERRTLNFGRGRTRGPYFKVLLQTQLSAIYPNCTSSITEDKTSLSCRGKLLLEGRKKRPGFKEPMQTPFIPYLHFPILTTADRVSLSCRGNLLWEGKVRIPSSRVHPSNTSPCILHQTGSALAAEGK